MQFAQRQRLSRGIWRALLTALGLGVLLGFAGPFGTYPAFPTATRYAFWIGLAAAGVLAVAAAQAVLPARLRRAAAIRIGALTLLSALPMTFVVAWTMTLIQPGRVYLPQQLLGLFWGVAAVQLLVVIATNFAATAGDDSEGAEDRGIHPEPATDAARTAIPSALLNKLPPALGSDLIALETEDHYLRVTTTQGSALILMRMADAAALLDARLGAQVHRRWWVAEAAVAGVVTDGNRLSLRLVDDSLVPVGRTFAASVKERFGPPSSSARRS